MSLDKQLNQLEKLVEEMESDSISLDEAFTKYESAFTLAKETWDTLKQHQTRFSVLTKQADEIIESNVKLDT